MENCIVLVESDLADIGKVVRGSLVIASKSLTDLDGLSALTSVGGNLRIVDNDALTNLDGLSALTSVGGDLEISDNAILTDLSGIGQSPIRIKGDISIRDNPRISREKAAEIKLLHKVFPPPAGGA